MSKTTAPFVRRSFIAIVLSFVFIGVAQAGSTKTIIDPAELEPEYAARYRRAESLIDAWMGAAEPAIESAALTESVLKEYPNFLPARVEAARAQIIGGSATGDFHQGFEAARDILLKAIALDPKYPKAHVVLAHAYIYLGDFNAARRHLVEAERIGTTNPWLHFNWADLLAKTGEFDKATLRCIRVLESGTQNTKALSSALSLLLSLTSKSRGSPGNDDVAELVALLPMSRQQLLALGNRLLSEDQPDRRSLQIAKAIADLLVLKNTQDVSGLILLADYHRVSGYLGHSLELRDDYEPEAVQQARMSYMGAIRIDNRAAAGYAGLARQELDAGQVANAQVLLDGVRERGINSRELEFERVRLKYFLGDVAGAIKGFESFVKEGGQQGRRARRSLVSIHINQKDLVTADRLFLEGSLLDPTGPQGLGAYSYFVYKHLQDIDKAIAYATQSLAYGPNDLAYRTLAEGLYTKSALSYLASDQEEGDIWLARALQAEPDTEVVLQRIDSLRPDAFAIRAIIAVNRIMVDLQTPQP